MEFYAFEINFRNLFNVLAVFLTHQNICDSGTFGSEDLLLDAANGKNFSSKRYFAGHGCVATHFTLGQGRGDAGCNGDSC